MLWNNVFIMGFLIKIKVGLVHAENIIIITTNKDKKI